MKPLPGQQSLFGAGPSALPQYDAAPAVPLNPTVAESDAPRLRTALERLLEHMADHEWHEGPSLVPIGGMGFGQRLHELKKAGHPIESEAVSRGVWKYRLLDRGES